MAKKIAGIGGYFLGSMLTEYPLMLITLFNKPWLAAIWAFIQTINHMLHEKVKQEG